MSSFGWGTSFFYHPTPKYNLWNHFRPFIIDFDLELILIFESENRLVNPQCGSAVSLKCGGLASTGTMIAPVAITIVSIYVYIVPLLYFLLDVIDAIRK